MKRTKIVILIASIITALTLFTTSCSNLDGRKGKIGYTCSDLTNPFFKLIANSMAEEAAKYGYELVALDGERQDAAILIIVEHDVQVAVVV